MSEYFTNLPSIVYDIERKKPSTAVLVTDIFRRNFILLSTSTPQLLVKAIKGVNL